MSSSISNPLLSNEHQQQPSGHLASQLSNHRFLEGSLASETSGNVEKDERNGLTTEQAEAQYKIFGYNELPVIVVPLWYIFLTQFTGTMPYMLELACILSLAVADYVDFAIIATMIVCNGYLGFHEELKAKESLEELTNKMEQKIAVLRDGHAQHLLTRLLVPGDVILLVGGCSVPADVEWLEGDVLSIDTAALTGEPLPRKYPSEEHGKLILCGCTVRAGEAYCVVRKTGTNTEIGSTQEDIMKDKATAKVSLFEQRVLFVVKIIILVSLLDVLIIFLVQGLARGEFENNIKELILTCLSIIIAAVPVALPLVLQVTMALGAGKMAREYNAVVTSLPALQDISSMSVLCSDKTGTLTTAKISIQGESVWTADGYTAADLALYAALASNRDKKEDPIDRSVINFFDGLNGLQKGMQMCQEFVKVRGVGFNPIYKRVLYEFTHPVLGNVTIAKGLPAKVIDTSNGGVDDAADQWKVEDVARVLPQVSKIDYELSKAGYKTLGVSIKINDGPFKFVGILPMLDPPRIDSEQTVKNLNTAGVEVKMITGDHLNIAVETARLIGMGVNIHHGEATREGTETRNELIRNADGFAQVLPRDKREVVLVLRNIYNIVTGMTGDGVNDAPALSAAQCGVAVDDATDAAKNAAAIILTSPGLSAIYMAVVESRRIFRKLKAYVTYRFAATIQIVITLSLLIFISDCPVNSLFVILLALFNDLTMLPIAYDNQQASALPESPEVGSMLLLSLMLGVLETVFSILYAYGAGPSGLFHADYHMDTCDKKMQAGIWLQMSIAAELLIFSARAPSYIWVSIKPSSALTISVLLGCLVTTLLAGIFDYFGGLPVGDMVLIWIYNIITLVVIDVCKVQYLVMMDEKLDVLPEAEVEKLEHAAKQTQHAAQESMRMSKSVKQLDKSQGANSSTLDALMYLHDDDVRSRASSIVNRMDSWAARKSNVYIQDNSSKNLMQSFNGNSMSLYRDGHSRGLTQRESTVIPSSKSYGPNLSSISGRDVLTSGSFRPNTPANKALARSFRR
jgi:H+-transporting ATPase